MSMQRYIVNQQLIETKMELSDYQWFLAMRRKLMAEKKKSITCGCENNLVSL
jgi:hypothetical protein